MADFTVTLGSAAELDPEEKRLRMLRAKEVLSGAGWLFDEQMSDLTRDMLGTSPEQSGKREELFHQIDALAQVKGRLMGIIHEYEAKQKAHEQRNPG